jgi:hypothetical protein
MSKLLESILNRDYVSANELFEERMVELQEQKLYEEKRMLAAQMNEAMGGKTIAQARADIEARGITPRKASDVLQDPKDRRLPPIGSKSTVKTKKKKVSEETLDEAGLAPTTWRAKLYRTGLRAVRDVEREKTAADGTDVERQAADLRKSHGVERPGDSKRPGIIRRNVNTLMGRKANYVKPETPADEKGGRGGKVLRKAGKVLGFAGRVAATMLQSAE